MFGEPVEVEFDMVHCGAGVLDACCDSLWAAVDDAVAALAAERGADIPRWLPPGQRLAFVPGFLDNDFRATNRPTYQQLLESARADRRRPPSPFQIGGRLSRNAAVSPVVEHMIGVRFSMSRA